MKNIEYYTVDDFDNALDEIHEKITNDLTPSDTPKAHILVGQPGAGKSTLQEIVIENNKNTAVINGDDYRKYHPNYEEIFAIHGADGVDYTQPFSNAVTNAIIDRLSDENYNIVIEGTGRRAEVPLKTCRELKIKGYSVELMVMCCNKEISWQSTFDRCEEMKKNGELPRAVPRDKFEESVKALPDTVDRLYTSGEFDEIKLFDRSKKCLYKMTSDNYNPSRLVKHILNNIPRCEKNVGVLNLTKGNFVGRR